MHNNTILHRVLVVHGTLINVGAPDTKLPQLSAFDLLPNGCKLGGSATGSKQEAVEMLVRFQSHFRFKLLLSNTPQ